MSHILKYLEEKGIAKPPGWLCDNIIYLTMMGSHAYGVNTKDSDFDCYGVVIPKKIDLFTHLKGEIPGFGKQIQRFETYQEHHLKHPNGKEYDFQIYSIVKYFQLAMENNPNVLESLFTPQECVLYISPIGQLIRENRRKFLHKGAKFKYLGYCYSSLHKMSNPERTGKRKTLYEEHGFDIKFGYHVLRLLDYGIQILETGDLDLRKNNEQFKAVRNGELKEQDIRDIFNIKEKYIEELYTKSTLQHKPNEDEIKQLLLNCLEHHYGSLAGAIEFVGKEQKCIDEIQGVLRKYGY